MDKTLQGNIERATIGGGCFWCIEAVFSQISGVKTMRSGFSGGEDANPDYRVVCSGQSEHIEVVEIEFDAAVLPFGQLLAVFFAAHDPTTLNRQGNDVGPQYRSVVFYHDESQQQTTEKVIEALGQSGIYPNPIVTEVRPAMPFYTADDYHQDFYANNPYNPYCQIIIAPKMEKIRALFAENLL